MNNSLAIVMISAGIFIVYLEQTGKLNSILDVVKTKGAGGQGVSQRTTTQPIFGFRGRYYVTPTGALNVTDAGTY